METRKKTFGARTKLSAPRAKLGSIPRMNSNHFNSSSFSFILDKSLQLVETPIANPIVHSLSTINLSYSFEVFHNNLVSIKIGNNLFADVVIDPSHKPLLFSRNLFEKPSGASSAFGLEFATQELEFPLTLLDLATLEKSFVRSYSDIVYSEVNAENSILEIRAFDINLFRETEHKEAPAFFINSQQALVKIPSKIIFETFRNLEWDFNSTSNSRQTQNIIFDTGTSIKVIPNGTSVDYGFGLSSLDDTTSLFDTTNSQLTRQSHRFESFIDKGMEFDIIFNLSFPSNINTILQSVIIDIQSSNNLFSSFNLDFGCCPDFHSNLYDSYHYKTFGGEVAIPSTTKVIGILATFL